MFTTALFTIARTWKQPKHPSAEDEEDVIHITQWNTTLSHKKNKTVPSEAAWMDPETAILSEVRHRKTNIIRY